MSKFVNESAVRHGGDLSRAISVYGGEAKDWLDLSTGISPWSYPPPTFSIDTWRNLPPPLDALLESAARYYQCQTSDIIATPGSQLAIRLIPQQFDTPQRVALPTIGYQEHALSWQSAGHTLYRYDDLHALENLVRDKQVDHCVLITPNNPTCEFIEQEKIIALSTQLSGLMIIDLAFADITNLNTLSVNQYDNIVQLRSLGKFFGLAGARIGFAISKHSIIKKLRYLLEPWSLAAPSIELATLALNDSEWQGQQRTRVSQSADHQRKIMIGVANELDGAKLVDQHLFFTLFAKHNDIVKLHRDLAKQQVWSRLGDSYISELGRAENWLRLSLAGDHLSRLASALKVNQHKA